MPNNANHILSLSFLLIARHPIHMNLSFLIFQANNTITFLHKKIYSKAPYKTKVTHNEKLDHESTS